MSCQSTNGAWAPSEAADASSGAASYEAERQAVLSLDDSPGYGFNNFGLAVLEDSDGDGLPDRRGEDRQATDDVARLLVHTGALVLAVPDASGARKQLAELATGLGGYVQSERDAAIVLRIPSARFREGLESAAKVGREISRRIDVQDVTEQYVDLELRVKNARALRDRLEALLQKCDDVKSALEVERELTRVRLEIEQLEAQLRALGQRTSFGTLEVELRQITQAPRSTAALPFSWLGTLGVENLLGRGGAR
jgi:hypothetical protein